jgi:hypothetical protein
LLNGKIPTRFWISSMVSQRREIADARAIFKHTNNKTNTQQVIVGWSTDLDLK